MMYQLDSGTSTLNSWFRIRLSLIMMKLEIMWRQFEYRILPIVINNLLAVPTLPEKQHNHPQIKQGKRLRSWINWNRKIERLYDRICSKPSLLATVVQVEENLHYRQRLKLRIYWMLKNILQIKRRDKRRKSNHLSVLIGMILGFIALYPHLILLKIPDLRNSRLKFYIRT